MGCVKACDLHHLQLPVPMRELTLLIALFQKFEEKKKKRQLHQTQLRGGLGPKTGPRDR